MTAGIARRGGDLLAGSFFARPAEIVARELLGRVLVSRVGGVRVAGRIVETEAYLGPHDPACHAAERVGRTRRNRSMFGEPGIAYVYRIYGIHWCLNVVTDAIDFPAAVLVRALEPIAGVDVMLERRGLAGHEAGNARGNGAGAARLVAGGPGRVAQALGVTGELDGHPLHRPPLTVTVGSAMDDADVLAGPRIGVTRASDWPLRFRVRGNPNVSR